MAAWMRVPKFNPRAAELADGHYSRRTVGSPQFMPPGQTVVLLKDTLDAVFGWWRPHPRAGLRAMNNLDGWTCTIFRNCSAALSSALILEAEEELRRTGTDCGPDGLLTYVWDARVRSANPGYCFTSGPAGGPPAEAATDARRCSGSRGVKTDKETAWPSPEPPSG